LKASMASSICSNVALVSSWVSKPSFLRASCISLASLTALRNGFTGYLALPTIRASRRVAEPRPVGREIVKVCSSGVAIDRRFCHPVRSSDTPAERRARLAWSNPQPLRREEHDGGRSRSGRAGCRACRDLGALAIDGKGLLPFITVNI